MSIIIIAAYTVLLKRLFDKKEYWLLFIIIIILIRAFIDQFIVTIEQNAFLLAFVMLFNETRTKRKITETIKKE